MLRRNAAEQHTNAHFFQNRLLFSAAADQKAVSIHIICETAAEHKYLFPNSGVFAVCALTSLRRADKIGAETGAEPTQERVRICDIAEELGLSTATVSNVIHGHTLRDGFLASVLLPLFVCEASWSLGENVCAAIYGRMGTEQSAAMTLTAPIQGLAIGALCGLSQAAGVIVGKRLGGEDYDGAYRAAKRLMVYGAVGASVLCAARCRAT